MTLGLDADSEGSDPGTEAIVLDVALSEIADEIAERIEQAQRDKLSEHPILGCRLQDLLAAEKGPTPYLAAFRAATCSIVEYKRENAVYFRWRFDVVGMLEGFPDINPGGRKCGGLHLIQRRRRA
jgi:hypothetical protein